eukprot:CAMPEP_0202362772 /NCGR_PEP_ID=MMETSP1126-20121109/14826_1 /ASSEMBLY_ACC=CAM_ASM_000457 /TAXON_ID=3047 /ORGANISM="Dunaliella tertiolecta, Strain CCMP1320" /LENGTH=111 /DNA_ID=CAMNT_0048957041 /DNA_START=36 /DNA_END=368 /DNA_ORIENTATION=+
MRISAGTSDRSPSSSLFVSDTGRTPNPSMKPKQERAAEIAARMTSEWREPGRMNIEPAVYPSNTGAQELISWIGGTLAVRAMRSAPTQMPSTHTLHHDLARGATCALDHAR